MAPDSVVPSQSGGTTRASGPIKYRNKIDVMNMTRPKKDQLVITSSKRAKIVEIAKSKSIKKHKTVMAQLKIFLSSGEIKLNKYSGLKHHTAETQQ